MRLRRENNIFLLKSCFFTVLRESVDLHNFIGCEPHQTLPAAP